MPRTLSVYDADTGEYLYTRTFLDTERPGGHVGTTETPPQRWRMKQEKAQAFFRDGKWVYEPIPEDEQEEIEPDQ